MRKQRLVIAGLFAVFFLPLVIAAWVYFNPGTLSSKPRGHLITPVQALAPLHLSSADETNHFRRLWTLLYWNNGPCDLRCEANLFKMRQVRLSLGKNIARVQTVYLSPELKPMTVIKQLKTRHPKLVWTPSAANEELIKQMQSQPADTIYLVDTFGNLVMRYTDDIKPHGILRDLKKLLTI